MEVQPEQVLLQKTLVNIEGLGQQLYPELDLWQTAKPFLDRWTAQRYSPTRVFEGMQERSTHPSRDIAFTARQPNEKAPPNRPREICR